jgi:hypothetical protein
MILKIEYRYPNPNQGEFYITLNRSQSIEDIEINDISGKIVYRNKLFGNGFFKIVVHNIKPGVYFVKMTIAGEMIIQKIIVE